MLPALAFVIALAAQPPVQQAGQISAPQNQQQQAEPAPGTATVRGHVFAADTGQPLRKAQVRLIATEIRENRLATTDEQGAYEFTDVKPSRYTVVASKGSYVTLGYGQVRSADAAKPIEVLDRQTVERLDIALPHGGIITGRIVDDFGEPLSDVNVQIQRYQFVQGRRTLIPTGRSSFTNDLGEFRVFGIAPGQYYLSAVWRNPAAQNPNAGPADRLAIPQTFYPGVTSSSEAQRLTMAEGKEIDDLVMVLRPIKAAHISGTATGSDGEPMAPAMVMVLRSAGMGIDVAANAQVHPDGTFTLNGLAPGEYSLRAQKMGAPGGAPDIAMATVSLNGEDVDDVHLEAVPPSTATGRVIVDPAEAQQLPRTLSLAFFPAVFTGIPAPPPPPARVNDDYTFTVSAPPGVMRVTLGGFGQPPSGWSIRSVRVGGVDVTDKGIEFNPHEDIDGIEVELTNKVTSVNGLVTDSRGDPVKDYTVFAFSQDKDKWGPMSRYRAVGRPDQDGRFKMPSLPPGDYYIVALDKIESGQDTDPDFLESIRSRATMFSLMEGETKTLDLKMTTAQ